jgi:hypothetical protein
MSWRATTSPNDFLIPLTSTALSVLGIRFS